MQLSVQPTQASTPECRHYQAIQQARDILANPDRYCLLDTETSALGKSAEVLQISILSLTDEVLLNRYCLPVGEIEPKAFETHGLSLEVLKQKDADSFSIVGPLIAATLDGKTPIIYNAPFDTRILAQSCSRYGLHTFLAKEDCIDLMRLRQRYQMANTTVKLGGNHDAVGDCRRMLEIIKEIAGADLNPDHAPLTIDNLDACKAACIKVLPTFRPLKWHIDNNVFS